MTAMSIRSYFHQYSNVWMLLVYPLMKGGATATASYVPVTQSLHVPDFINSCGLGIEPVSVV